MTGTISKSRLAKLLAVAREKKEAAPLDVVVLTGTIEKEPEIINYIKDSVPASTIPPSQLASLRTRLAARAIPSPGVPAESLMTYARPKLKTYDGPIPQVTSASEPVPETKIEVISSPSPSVPTPSTHIDMNGEAITYNTLQQEFVELAASGTSCVLIGAAGTGKTTCMQGALAARIQTGEVPLLRADGHKYLADGAPGCVIIAYTRRATNNIRKVLSEDLKANAITSHKLLEYAPEFFEIIDDEGNIKKSMQFVETRNEGNPLPATIATIVVEESSMLSVEMYNKINIALTHQVQWIFLGDINQLPPVFGSAVLGFRLLDLPTIELTEVYRQALESPIIRLAHRILSGSPIPLEEFESWKYPDQLTIHAWKKKISPDDATRTLAEFFKRAYDSGIYNIDEDIILIPYNKACGSIELNKHIANHVARATQRTTHEIVAGFNKHYYSIGDKVLYDKEDAEITDISTNNSYTGARFQAASKHLDYWGYNSEAVSEYNASLAFSLESTDEDIDFLLETMSAISSDDEERVRKASHVITLTLTDTGRDISIDTAADINNLLHAYALTVHKAQGSEWRKVYFCLHQSHATMMQRELLYTAVTRAKEELYVICEPDSFVKGIERQRIKGNTLEEKAEWFKGKLETNTRLAASGG